MVAKSLLIQEKEKKANPKLAKEEAARDIPKTRKKNIEVEDQLSSKILGCLSPKNKKKQESAPQIGAESKESAHLQADLNQDSGLNDTPLQDPDMTEANKVELILAMHHQVSAVSDKKALLEINNNQDIGYQTIEFINRQVEEEAHLPDAAKKL